MPKGVAATPEGRARRTAHAWAIAAKRIGVTLDEYARNRFAGLRWCYVCRRWRPEARFGPDRARNRATKRAEGSRGVDGQCIECRKLLDDSRGDRRRRRRELELELEQGGSDGISGTD